MDKQPPQQDFATADDAALQPSDAFFTRWREATGNPEATRENLPRHVLELAYWMERLLGWLDAHTEVATASVADLEQRWQAELEAIVPQTPLSPAAHQILTAYREHLEFPTPEPGSEDARLEALEALSVADRRMVHLQELAWQHERLLLYAGVLLRLKDDKDAPPAWVFRSVRLLGLASRRSKSQTPTSGPMRTQPRERPSALVLGGADLSVPSGPFLLTAGRAFYRPDLWEPAGNGLPATYKEGTNHVYAHPGDGYTALTLDQEEVTMAQVRALADDHYRALHIAMAVCLATNGGNYTAEKVRLHANTALSLMGRKKHEGAYRADDKAEFTRDLMALNNIWVMGAQTIKENGRLRVVTVRSQLLEVAYETEHNLLGEETLYSVKVALGEWARPLLGPDMRQTAMLLREVLKIDPRPGKGLIASRLGLFLCQHWKIRAHEGNYEQPWKVGSLLEGAGIKVPTHREERRRLREAVDAALDVLEEREVIAAWEYVRIEQASPTNAFIPWLEQASILIAPPPAVIEQYKRLLPARRRKQAAAVRRKTP